MSYVDLYNNLLEKHAIDLGSPDLPVGQPVRLRNANTGDTMIVVKGPDGVYYQQSGDGQVVPIGASLPSGFSYDFMNPEVNTATPAFSEEPGFTPVPPEVYGPPVPATEVASGLNYTPYRELNFTPAPPDFNVPLNPVMTTDAGSGIGDGEVIDNGVGRKKSSSKDSWSIMGALKAVKDADMRLGKYLGSKLHRAMHPEVYKSIKPLPAPETEPGLTFDENGNPMEVQIRYLDSGPVALYGDGSVREISLDEAEDMARGAQTFASSGVLASEPTEEEYLAMLEANRTPLTENVFNYASNAATGLGNLLGPAKSWLDSNVAPVYNQAANDADFLKQQLGKAEDYVAGLYNQPEESKPSFIDNISNYAASIGSSAMQHPGALGGAAAGLLAGALGPKSGKYKALMGLVGALAGASLGNNAYNIGSDLYNRSA